MRQLWQHIHTHRLWWGCAILTIAVILTVPATFGSIAQIRLNRYETRESAAGTRFLFKLTSTPEQVLSQLPDKRVRLVLRPCETGFLSRLRSYSDKTIGGIQVFKRGDDLVLTFSLRNPADGYRLHSEPGSGIVTLDLGPGMHPRTNPHRPAGRELIWSGAERLIREFDPPLRSDIPFTPVNRTPVFGLLNPEEAKLFQAGEGALYKGLGSDAEELFASFQTTDPRVKALALSRLGEARYMLQKYPEARKAFQEAEDLAPNLSAYNPSAYFAYGDCIARGGDLAAGRRVLCRLIAENAEKPYAQNLLVRLGDILLRNGREMEARAIYQTVLTYFPTSKAASQARMKQADRQIFTVDADSYVKLLTEYQELRATAGDFQQREEAAFKAALLQAMYGPVPEAIDQVADFEKRFPRSSYAQIMRAMHEDLLGLQVRHLLPQRQHQELLALVAANREHLAGSLKIPEFIPALVAAFANIGNYKQELELFRHLLDRGVPADLEPTLLAQMTEDAARIEDTQTMEWAAHTFIDRFPQHPQLGPVKERLAELLYRRSDHGGVITHLSWLSDRNARAASTMSYYYLGKAHLAKGSPAAAEIPMGHFIAAAGNNKGMLPLVADAYFSLGVARARGGDHGSALTAVTRGLNLAPPERQDQYRFKLAEIQAAAGRPDAARKIWEQVIKEGKDPEWQALAANSLANLEVAAQVERARKIMSRK